MIKRYNVTFQENKKYNPATRTVEVRAESEFQAINLFTSQFDSFKRDAKFGFGVPTGKKVKLIEIKEIKNEVKESEVV